MKIQKDSPNKKRVSAITLCDGWFSVKHSYILLKNTVQKLRNKYHSFRAKLLDLQLNSLAFITLKNADALFQSLNSFCFSSCVMLQMQLRVRSWYHLVWD